MQESTCRMSVPGNRASGSGIGFCSPLEKLRMRISVAAGVVFQSSSTVRLRCLYRVPRSSVALGALRNGSQGLSKERAPANPSNLCVGEGPLRAYLRRSREPERRRSSKRRSRPCAGRAGRAGSPCAR